VLIFTLGGGGGGTGSPSAAANTLVDAVNNKDVEKAKSVSCDPANAGDTNPLEDVPAGMTFKMSIAEEPKENGDTATGKLKFDISFQGQSASVSAAFTMQKKNGNWCVSKIEEPKLGG
jgi:hypothetical protein